MTRGPIEALSADGARVAIDVSARFTPRMQPDRGLERPEPPRHPAHRLDRTDLRGRRHEHGRRGLAARPGRDAGGWVVNQGGNTESDDTLVTAAIGGPQRVLARASRHGQVDGSQLTGSWLGGVVGDGSFLGVSTWTTAGSPSITDSALSRVRSCRPLQDRGRTPAWPRRPTAAAWPP